MISNSHLECEKVWLDKALYDNAEKRYYENLAKPKGVTSPHGSKQHEDAAKTTYVTKKCFVNLEKDKSGDIKTPEKVWFDKPVYDLAEKQYYEKLDKDVTQNANSWNSLAGEVAKARQHIKNSLQCIDDIASITSSNVVVEVNNRINTLEKENVEMKKKVKELTDLLSQFEQRLTSIEQGPKSKEVTLSKPTAPVNDTKSTSRKQQSDDDDGVDLFGSDSEEESTEAAKLKEQRLAEYAAKKSKKPALIAKSSIVLDVKPWDDTTDMKVMEQEVRKISADGLLWGASKLVPLAYGIHKLQISCVVEDEKVSVDWLQETIEETIQDYVQSVDIAAFNKI